MLSTSLAKSVRDHQRTAVDPLKDSARFKKHITVALDRVMAGTAVRMKEDQRGNTVSWVSFDNNIVKIPLIILSYKIYAIVLV